MLRFLLRALGLAALAGAFAAAVMDGARSIANSALSLSPTGTALAQIAPAKFTAFTSWAEKSHPKLWDPVLLDLLWVPTCVTLAILGTALMASGTAALNQWYEAAADSKMRRTWIRPIPTGRIPRNRALCFGLSLSGRWRVRRLDKPQGVSSFCLP